MPLPKKYWDQAEFWNCGTEPVPELVWNRTKIYIGLVPPLKASCNTGDRGQSPISLHQVAPISAGLQVSSLKSDYSMTLGFDFVHTIAGEVESGGLNRTK